VMQSESKDVFRTFLLIVLQVQTLVYGLHLPEDMADEQ
jgi:hypothetical protein